MGSPVERIREYHRELKEIRHDLHAHPELGFEETRTSTLVADKLASWGIEVHRGLAKTGVVGVVQGRGTSGRRAIGLRADMDCLPVHETGSVPYRSRHDRSEERRVGKEWRSRWSPDHEKKKSER